MCFWKKESPVSFVTDASRDDVIHRILRADAL